MGYDDFYLNTKREVILDSVKLKFPNAILNPNADDGTGRNNSIQVDLEDNSDNIRQLVYFFNEDKKLYFIGIKISSIDDANFQSLKKNMIEKYGTPSFNIKRTIRWTLKDTQNISLIDDNSYTVNGIMLLYKNQYLWDRYESSLNKNKYKKF